MAHLSFYQKWLQAGWQTALLVLLAGVLGLTVNQLRADRLPLVGDWSPQARLTQPSGDDLTIGLDAAQQAWLSHGAVFIDARPRDQYLLGHIEGACSLPWEAFSFESQEVLARISPDTPIITYCDGEACGLSHELAVALLGMGYSQVRVLVNGWSVWQMQHLPVATDESHCGSPAATGHGTAPGAQGSHE